ncbi:hypothetical protein WMY93_022686 [Mugilogobius chulae]|uniref:Fibronectin type-III domain-containing protein n=1 Tax=Mugilogobius chulae TaxID=88201 RepID=A0AAW0NBU9_9GOBI
MKCLCCAFEQGMVMVSPKMNPTICCQFEAAIVLLFHAKTFRRGFQVTVHVGNVRQTATVETVPAAPVNVSVSQLRADSALVTWSIPQGDMVIGTPFPNRDKTD